MKSTIFEILDKVDKAQTRSEKINLLRKNDQQPFRDLLQGCFDARIKWLLPEGPVPFKPNKAKNLEGVLWPEIKKLYLFVEGGNPNLSQSKRETLFIQLLETLDIKEANLLVSIKDKVMPFASVTYDLIKEAYNVNWPEYVASDVEKTSLNKPKIDPSKINAAWQDDNISPHIAAITAVQKEKDRIAEEEAAAKLKQEYKEMEDKRLSKRRAAAIRRREEKKAKLETKELEGVQDKETP